MCGFGSQPFNYGSEVLTCVYSRLSICDCNTVCNSYYFKNCLLHDVCIIVLTLVPDPPYFRTINLCMTFDPWQRKAKVTDELLHRRREGLGVRLPLYVYTG